MKVPYDIVLPQVNVLRSTMLRIDANDIHIDGHKSRRIRRAFRALRGA
jgi:hypothetical protein